MRTLSNLTFGQYAPGTSPLHTMDPRAKIILVFIFVLVAFFVVDYRGLVALAGFQLGLIGLARIRFHLIVRSLRPLLYIFVFTMVIHMMFTPGTPLLEFSIVRITEDGLVKGLFISARLLLLIVGTSLLTFTTTPVQLTDGIEHVLSPLKKVRVPVHEIAMMMAIALRFIPTLLAETDRIMKAQMARGADFETGSFLRRARSFLPLLIPLFVGVFQRADELAMAMESRCYRGGESRTRLRTLRMARADWVGAASVTSFLFATLVIGRF